MKSIKERFCDEMGDLIIQPKRSVADCPAFDGHRLPDWQAGWLIARRLEEEMDE